MSVFLRKYATATATGTHVGIPMVKAGSQDLAAGGDWTPVTGDVQVGIDGGTLANITALPTYTNGFWIFQLTIAELTGKSIRVKVVDAATKAVEDQTFIVETFGNASAMHAVDYTNAASFGLTAVPATIAGDVAGKVLGGGSGTIAGVGANTNLVQYLGLAVQPVSWTAQAITSTSITLASADPHFGISNVGDQVEIISATTGATQTGMITASNTSTGVQTIAAWSGSVTPTGAIVYGVNPQVVVGGGGGGGGGSDTPGTTTLLARIPAGPVALQSQVPAHFTNGTFASDGVFSAAALAAASQLQLDGGTVASSPTPSATSFSSTSVTLTATQSGAYVGAVVRPQTTASLGRAPRVVTAHTVVSGSPPRHDFTISTSTGSTPVVGMVAGDVFLIG